MKLSIKISIFTLSLAVLTSCSPKSYFTTTARNNVISKNIPLNKLQYYVDRTVVLRRELSSAETKISAGKIKIENGKSISIVKLKKNTPGICTGINANSLNISFDTGDGKNLTFGLPQNGTTENAYVLYTQSIDKFNYGKIMYAGQQYTIEPSGVRAKLKIKKSVANNVKVKKSKMKGIKVK